jgi:hypothetical protein
MRGYQILTKACQHHSAMSRTGFQFLYGILTCMGRGAALFAAVIAGTAFDPPWLGYALGGATASPLLLLMATKRLPPLADAVLSMTFIFGLSASLILIVAQAQFVPAALIAVLVLGSLYARGCMRRWLVTDGLTGGLY